MTADAAEAPQQLMDIGITWRAVLLSGVSFRYSAADPVILEEVNLEVAPGDLVPFPPLGHPAPRRGGATSRSSSPESCRGASGRTSGIGRRSPHR